MSKNIRLYKDLPDDSNTFYIDVKGAVTGVRYRGEFKSKIPSVKTHLEIDKHRAFLCGDMVEYLQPSTIIMYKQIAYLRFTLTDYAEFWEQSDLGADLKDANVIEEVYNQVLEFEEKWLKEAYPDRDGKDEDESEGNEAEA